jgi:hypothetical protein
LTYFVTIFPTAPGGVGSHCKLGGKRGLGLTYFVTIFATGHGRKGLAVLVSWEGERGLGLTCFITIFSYRVCQEGWQSLGARRERGGWD